jgi:hypothetical protein
MEQPKVKVFKYHDDMTMTVNEKSYSVKCLIEMSDEDFSHIYGEYELEMGNKVLEMEESKSQGFALMAFTSVMNIMERIRLERRILKLEQQT